MVEKKKPPKNKREILWIEAERRCRLNIEDVRMAKEMGLNPRSLIKNIPSKTEPWKLPVKDWIREMYQKRQDKSARKRARKEQAAAAHPVMKSKELPEESTTYSNVEDYIPEDQDDPPDSQEIQEENQAMLHRQEQFRIAAKYVADTLSNIPEVQKVVLFGSVSNPLEKEIPRFRRFRQAGIAIQHECQDVDVAVWVSDLNRLKAIQKARSRALNDLLEETQIGVAHHQVDVFVMEPETNRYLGRLCTFSTCPKRKNKCRVSMCGEPKFLQQHEGFKFDLKDLDDESSVILFERCEESG
jgi:hypothetical protein